MKNNNIINICATEHDGMSTRNLCITLQIYDNNITNNNHLQAAIKAACAEYVMTKEGKQTYENNNKQFNWSDFDMHVPNDICRKHGFIKINSMIATINTDWDEQLILDDFR